MSHSSWNCNWCTLSNDNSLQACNACRKKKGSNPIHTTQSDLHLAMQLQQQWNNNNNNNYNKPFNSNNNNNNNSNSNNNNANPPRTTRKRKTETSISSNNNPPHKKRKVSKPEVSTDAIKPTWRRKYQIYKQSIYDNYKLLKQQPNTQDLILKSKEIKEQIHKFKLSFNNNNSNNNNKINFDEYISLICVLAHGRKENVIELINNIKSIIGIAGNEYDNKLREIIIKYVERNFFGIKPSKEINKYEEKIEMKQNVEFTWNKCRVYEWNYNKIPITYKMNNNNIKTDLHKMMGKYGSFCNTYENSKLNIIQKENKLQECEDQILKLQGKQEQARKEKEMKEQKEKEKEETLIQKMKSQQTKLDKKYLMYQKSQIHNKEMKKQQIIVLNKWINNKKWIKFHTYINPKTGLIEDTSEGDSLTENNGRMCRRKSEYRKLFPVALYDKQTIIAPVHSINESECKYNEIIHVENGKLIMHNGNGKCIKPTVMPGVTVDGNKLQWKYREFREDNRPPFFGMNGEELMEGMKDLNIRKLCRRPFGRIVSVIDYDGADSGVEWYDDIEDLNESDCDSVEMDRRIEQEEMRLKELGMLREDGFEIDDFIANSDDDNNCDIIQSIKKIKLLKNKNQDEYPLNYRIKNTGRYRCDEYDGPINIQLPTIKELSRNHQHALSKLAVKKAFIVQEEMKNIEFTENNLETLIENENKKYNEKERVNKKVNEDNKEKDKKHENDKNNKNICMKQEMDSSDEDNDIKMKGN